MPLLKAPKNGVAIRMYRPGHGDCFLLAFPGAKEDRPAYVLIDCGYKPGSPAFLSDDRDIKQIAEHIRESTGGHIDLVVITHEHEDHVNGFWRKNDPPFRNFTFEHAWFPWTESPDDPLAKSLRKKHGDVILKLAEARKRLALDAGLGVDNPVVQRIDSMLGFELGGTGDEVLAAASDPEKSIVKQGMRYIRDEADKNKGAEYLSPDGEIRDVPNAKNIRAYVLGPPRSEKLLADEDPRPNEAFPDKKLAFSLGDALGFGDMEPVSPFGARYHVSLKDATKLPFFQQHYGEGSASDTDEKGAQVPDAASWRRIDSDWLLAAESLALKLNKGINNTSLVLAFELPKSKKVLLFAADAQRGNWISWSKLEWKEGSKTTTVKELLGRTVLYKVGHHGSHNATLAGTLNDEHANLSWMATEPAAAREFTAMITAVNKWALQLKPKPWRHPLPSIKKALLEKTAGRVFQTDTGEVKKADGVSAAAWKEFEKRVDIEDLYFDYVVKDA